MAQYTQRPIEVTRGPLTRIFCDGESVLHIIIMGGQHGGVWVTVLMTLCDDDTKVYQAETGCVRWGADERPKIVRDCVVGAARQAFANFIEEARADFETRYVPLIEKELAAGPRTVGWNGE